MAILNGAACPDAAGLSVTALLAREGYPTKMIAVECNGSIIPREQYETHLLAEEDVIEVVQFVGGG